LDNSCPGWYFVRALNPTKKNTTTKPTTTMKFIIEKTIPIPIAKSGLIVDMTETMKDLQPGDSFLVLFNKTRPKGATMSAYHYAKKKTKDRKFTSLTEKNPAGATLGLRIWRLQNPVPKPNPPTVS
jgi:hypothetical protein